MCLCVVNFQIAPLVLPGLSWTLLLYHLRCPDHLSASCVFVVRICVNSCRLHSAGIATVTFEHMLLYSDFTKTHSIIFMPYRIYFASKFGVSSYASQWGLAYLHYEYKIGICAQRMLMKTHGPWQSTSVF